ncbi:phage baseplate assembly protein V [Salmonella enterica subsp. salamae]|nr:phage baseplate assembly protein V [Salmonella enterica subsp. salamae]ECJ2281386.1 phage baseplate assembly protein V [Salmonella enterica subsp. salamae]
MSEVPLYSISALQQQIKNIVKRGSVHSVQESPPRCRVTFGTDAVNGDVHVSDWLLWQAASDSERTVWNMPAVGAPVIVISEGGVLKNGVVYPLGITDNQTPAGSTASEHVVRYRDGAKISYNSETHTLDFSGVDGGIVNLSATGPVTVNATDVTINADNINAVVNNQITAKAESATVNVKNNAVITAENSVSVTSSRVDVTADKTTINGDLDVEGTISATGDISAFGDIADMNGSQGTMQRMREIYDSHNHNYDDGVTEMTNQPM